MTHQVKASPKRKSVRTPGTRLRTRKLEVYLSDAEHGALLWLCSELECTQAESVRAWLSRVEAEKEKPQRPRRRRQQQQPEAPDPRQTDWVSIYDVTRRRR